VPVYEFLFLLLVVERLPRFVRSVFPKEGIFLAYGVRCTVRPSLGTLYVDVGTSHYRHFIAAR
jgi:hypothetical protein